jgi:hypothetical protein
MLLNEVQRQQRTLNAQAQQIAGVKVENQALQTAVAELKAEFEKALKLLLRHNVSSLQMEFKLAAYEIESAYPHVYRCRVAATDALASERACLRCNFARRSRSATVYRTGIAT